MKIFSAGTFLGVVNQTLINVNATWFILAFVSPGFFGISSIQQYIDTLIKYMPFGIIGIVVASFLTERIKKHDR